MAGRDFVTEQVKGRAEIEQTDAIFYLNYYTETTVFTRELLEIFPIINVSVLIILYLTQGYV